MASTFDRLCSDQLVIGQPAYLRSNIHYECIMGSTAYGVADDTSDIDIYGFAIPPKEILFPYSYGNILGFGIKPQVFEQYQKHHIIDKARKKEYDITIYNIVKYFQLCMENNPNMIDSLFVPTRCVLHSTAVGNHVRNNRHLFLSKKVYHTFKGYAFNQLHMMKNKYAKDFVDYCKLYDVYIYADRKTILAPIKKDEKKVDYVISLLDKIETSKGKRSKRLETIYKYGYDVKFGYHLCRLLDECQMILEEETLDLTRSREMLKAIRRGEWSMKNIINYFDEKMLLLERLYSTSKLRYTPDEEAIKTLLLECIEMHYGEVKEYVDSNRIIKYLLDAQENITKILRTF
jgi:predicted nucleotidyltransferase